MQCIYDLLPHIVNGMLVLAAYHTGLWSGRRLERMEMQGRGLNKL